MTLQRKTLAVSVMTLAGLICVTYVTSSHILFDAFDMVERRHTLDSGDRVAAGISDVLFTMRSTADDWSDWNDMYAFAKRPTAAFVSANLAPSTFSTLRLDLLMVTGPDGRIAYVTRYDKSRKALATASPDVRSALWASRHLLRTGVITDSVSGVMVVDGEIYLIIVRPILTNHRKGPVAGALMIGRRLDAGVTKGISDLTGNGFRLDVNPSAGSMQGQRYPELSHTTVRRLDEYTVCYYATLGDIWGRPALYLRVNSSLDTADQLRLSRTALLLSLLVSCLAFGCANIAMLRRFVLARLTYLSKGVRTIQTAGDTSLRLTLGGTDELSSLSNDINEMLGRIEQSQSLLRENEEQLSRMLEIAGDGILIIDPSGNITFANAPLENMLDLRREDIFGRPFADTGWTIQRMDGTEYAPSDYPSVRALRTDTSNSGNEIRLHRTDGKTVPVLSTASPLHDSAGNVIGAMVTLTDITERKVVEDQITHQAFHDPLTGLPNRALFIDRLIKTLGKVERTGEKVAVIFLDLDNFKAVNDTLGHAMGDLLLTSVARRIEKCLRVGDSASRFGGDEFTMLVESVPEDSAAIDVARRLIQAFVEPFVLGATRLVVTPSVGIAISQVESSRADDLLQNADAAMYKAKTSGKGRWAAFEPGMTVSSLERMEMDDDLLLGSPYKPRA